MPSRSRLFLAAAGIAGLGALASPALSRSSHHWLPDVFQHASGQADLPPAYQFTPTASWQVCFTPGGACDDMIASAIGEARSEILFQAYEFTNRKIARALLDAKARGVTVMAVFDKSQRPPNYSLARTLVEAGIPTRVDEQPKIAHNKVIVIGQSTTVIGSFNFTVAAERDNAENALIIRGEPNVANEYRRNWTSRWDASVPF